MQKKISRKQFLKQAAGWGIAAAGFTQLPLASLAASLNKKENNIKSIRQVIIIRNPAIQSPEGILNKPILSQMLDQGMMKFTGKRILNRLMWLGLKLIVSPAEIYLPARKW
jgi:hypothetical protein